MTTMSAKEASAAWGVSPRRVTLLCSTGKIPGAKKVNDNWQIPVDAKKPADTRVRSGIYRKSPVSSLLPLPVGISDYRLASTEYYYVDKTLMIRDFLDQRPMVSLFTRPRRFGKTLNMDMLRVFFEKTDEDTSVYFKNKAIWACGQKYRDYQGKYPVIFLTFKDVKRNTWEETYVTLTLPQALPAMILRRPPISASFPVRLTAPTIFPPSKHFLRCYTSTTTVLPLLLSMNMTRLSSRGI